MRFITEICLLFYYGQWAMLIGGVLCAHSQKTGPVRRSAHETRGEKEARTLRALILITNSLFYLAGRLARRLTSDRRDK